MVKLLLTLLLPAIVLSGNHSSGNSANTTPAANATSPASAGNASDHDEHGHEDKKNEPGHKEHGEHGKDGHEEHGKHGEHGDKEHGEHGHEEHGDKKDSHEGHDHDSMVSYKVYKGSTCTGTDLNDDGKQMPIPEPCEHKEGSVYEETKCEGGTMKIMRYTDSKCSEGSSVYIEVSAANTCATSADDEYSIMMLENPCPIFNHGALPDTSNDTLPDTSTTSSASDGLPGMMIALLLIAQFVVSKA